MTALAGPGVGLGPLAPDGQFLLVPEAPVAADVDQPLDVHGDFLAEVALDLLPFLDDLADLVDLVLGQGLDLLVLVDLGLFEDLVALGPADPVDVGQPDLDPLVRREGDACDSCHVCTSFIPVFVYASGWSR